MFKSVKAARSQTADALILAVTQGKSGATLGARAKELDADGSIAAACKRAECTGKPGAVAEAYPRQGKPAKRVLLVGVGEKKSVTADTIRTAVAAAARRLAPTGDSRIHLDLSDALDPKSKTLTSERAGQCAGEAFGLLAFNVDSFKGTAARQNGSNGPTRTAVSLHSDDADFVRGLKRGIGLAESANVSRLLSATPANIATNAYIASEARKLARQFDSITVTVIKGEALKKEKLEGLINVGKASENPPCLVRIAYKPSRAKKGATPVVLIGKTIMYDSGGLSIKTGGSMRGMKGDKDGGCAVLGAMHAVASVVKPNRPVVALLACAENSISDEAYRPDDILTFRNGVTVEVTNTDAEGRLVLADALCYACDKEKPGAIIDMATLTGGVVVALGSTFCGMWCDDDDLRGRVECAAAATGERVWRLPHHQEYRDMMKSDIADIINSNPNRKAHPIQGAAFLSYFVKPDIPWCHLDIAGTHVADTDSGPFAKTLPTGFGVRLLAEMLAQA
jgi:leucyl aminopeptidase